MFVKARAADLLAGPGRRMEQRGGLLKPAGRGESLQPEWQFAALFNLDRLGELQGRGIFTDPGGQNLCAGS